MKRLQEMKVSELRAECKNLSIPSYSKMKKSGLIEALSQALQSNGHDPKTFMFEVADNGSRQAGEQPIASQSNNQDKGPGR